ncbi:hypothetical protein J1N35_015278 [Gossypium stocksii]|uniref:DUF4283 domain-containing protein n=1 Tax=Gossypium stocksii TaxID=47602 RepID=A0A9D3VW44_9ROSI|nr:hypothetical protein J1N35_015278 [Gossypium stocksii]
MENDLVNLRIDKEDEAWELHGEEGLGKSLYEYCLVGYFLTASVVHFQALRNAMANRWHQFRGVLISNLGEKHYLFKFYHEVDIDQVVNEAPRTFNNHLLLFHRLKGEEDPLQISLATLGFRLEDNTTGSGGQEIGGLNGTGKDLMEHDLKDKSIENMEGKKRPRNSNQESYASKSSTWEEHNESISTAAM